MARTEREANNIAANQVNIHRAWGFINIKTQIIPHTYTLP